MNKLIVVAKNEFYRYFTSPLAYVYLISFLLLNGSFAIYFGHFLEIGQANLLPMFSFQPWLYLLFVSGIAMRLWSEEFRSKTILQITTMPISLSALVWGKFLAAWTFCSLGLILTFPFWITVNILGNPDNPVILCSYFGSFILAGVMLAISQTMSALTKNQVIALVLSVFANLLFFLSGLEYVLDILRGFLPETAIDTIASFSFLSHLETIIFGLLELRDIIFFASLITLFNFATILIISFKTSGTSAWFKSTQKSFYIIILFSLFLGFAGINMLANTWLRNIRIDFTQEKFFTLTSATQNILKTIPNRITAKLYFSPIITERNPQTRILYDKVRLLLEQYSRLSNGELRLQLLNPEPLSNIEDEAIAAGLQAFPLIDSNINAYFGLILIDEANNKQIIKLFPFERQNLLEQDLTEAIYLLNHQKKNLGILTSLPMFEEAIENIVTPQWEIINRLKQFYNIRKIDNQNNNLDDIDALIIAHPRELTDETIDNIKKYNMHGGKILAFFDIAAEATQLLAPQKDILKASDYAQLTDFWGIRFLDNAVVTDFDNSTFVDVSLGNQYTPEFTQDLIQFYIPRSSFNSELIYTNLLQKMMTTSASIFVPQSNAPIDVIPLITIGTKSQLFSADVIYKNIHPSYVLRNFKADNRLKIFSAYIKSRDPQKPFEVIVVGDSDLLYDNFWVQHSSYLNSNYTVPILDNANFVFNTLDMLLNDNTLVSLRGKNIINRPFDNIEMIRRQSLQNFKIKENEIFENIDKVKIGLDEITAKRSFEGRENFTVDELAIIGKIRRQLDNERQNLLKIRTNLNKDINRIYTYIKFYNIYAIPLLIILMVLILKLHHGISICSEKPQFNKQFWIIIGCSLLLLTIGLLTAWQTQRSYRFANPQPIFTNINDTINKIDTITFQNRQTTLTLRKENNLWTIDNHPYAFAKQKRISYLLSSLLSGRLLEPRTNKLDNFIHYGLIPLSSQASTQTVLRLSNGQKILHELEIGHYDIDLGRGLRGAYLKFPNNYNIWLSDLDFVDLNLDWHNWSYSNLWDLHFGRFIAINDIKESNFVSNIARILLNTTFENILSQKPSNATLLQSLKIISEENNEFELSFYEADNKIYAHYKFIKTTSETDLKIFADYAKSVFYEIPHSKWEELKDVIDGYHQAQ